MAYWSKEEIFKLISIWSKDNIQTRLRETEVYSKLSCELYLAGYNLTYEQYQEKLKKLHFLAQF